MVRILKDGEYNDFSYKKGEIYNIISEKNNYSDVILDVEHDKDVIVTLFNHHIYGIEAELITENNIVELW
jgi:hypothetical protein